MGDKAIANAPHSQRFGAMGQKGDLSLAAVYRATASPALIGLKEE
jgi:hypothetical protein